VKRLTLSPAQVLATDDLCPEAEITLKIYFQVLKDSRDNCLPPIIVGTIRSTANWKKRLEEGYSRWVKKEPAMVELRRREYNTVFRTLSATPYYILDGNNRALAAALNRKNIQALYLDGDTDLADIQRMLNDGELLSFPHKAQSIEELEGRFLQHFLHLNNVPPDHSLIASRHWINRELMTVATRAFDLCTRKLLPPYMIKHYSRQKWIHGTLSRQPRNS
jgi:hypothetical protein